MTGAAPRRGKSRLGLTRTGSRECGSVGRLPERPHIIAIVETDSCFRAQPRQGVTWRQVVQNPPPPALFRFPSHITSHHLARGAVFSSIRPLSLLPQDGSSERDAVLSGQFAEES